MLCRSSHEHGAGQAADRRVAHQAFLISELQPQVRENDTASSSFWNHRQLQRTSKTDALSAPVDVFRRRIERFAGGNCGVAFVVLEHGRHIRRRRDVGTIRLSRRDKESDGPVVGLQVMLRDALNIVGSDFSHPVSIEEHQAPITHAGPFADPQSDAIGAVQKQIEFF